MFEIKLNLIQKWQFDFVMKLFEGNYRLTGNENLGNVKNKHAQSVIIIAISEFRSSKT